ncbi:hypothetical protein AAVH_30714, partial [Aphelenchoides avenae]
YEENSSFSSGHSENRYSLETDEGFSKRYATTTADHHRLMAAATATTNGYGKLGGVGGDYRTRPTTPRSGIPHATASNGPHHGVQKCAIENRTTSHGGDAAMNGKVAATSTPAKERSERVHYQSTTSVNGTAIPQLALSGNGETLTVRSTPIRTKRTPDMDTSAENAYYSQSLDRQSHLRAALAGGRSAPSSPYRLSAAPSTVGYALEDHNAHWAMTTMMDSPRARTGAAPQSHYGGAVNGAHCLKGSLSARSAIESPAYASHNGLQLHKLSFGRSSSRPDSRQSNPYVQYAGSSGAIASPHGVCSQISLGPGGAPVV